MKQKHHPRLLLSALILLVGFWTVSAAAQGQPLSGDFQVLSANDAGNGLMQVTLKLRFSNRSAENVTVQKLAVLAEPSARAGHVVSLTLADHGSAEMTQEFTVPSGGYRHWVKSRRLTLLVTAQGTDGSPQTLPVVLGQNSFPGVN